METLIYTIDRDTFTKNGITYYYWHNYHAFNSLKKGEGCEFQGPVSSLQLKNFSIRSKTNGLTTWKLKNWARKIRHSNPQYLFLKTLEITTTQ